MRRATVLVVAGVLLLGACASADPPEDRAVPPSKRAPVEATVPVPSPSPTFGFANAVIETDGEPVLLTVEMAETDEQRGFGLMFRRSLPEDRGMAFIFFEEHSGGFFMKNTLIPLSIAFFDVDGEILSILDMEPCREEPCKIYDPGVPYYGALEVNQGFFDRHGVTEGDIISISR